jgi:hypothetical protein
MRKLLTAVFALVAALAFFVVGSPSANAFGSEVLGCNVDSIWTANSCDSSGMEPLYGITPVFFSPHNTSGTYTTSWYVHNANGVAVTQTCYANYGNTPCIYSGCAAGSMECEIVVRVGLNDKAFTAALTLTQSGQTRTISATATIYAA